MHKPKFLMTALLGCLAVSLSAMTPQHEAQGRHGATIEAVAKLPIERAKPVPDPDRAVTDAIADYIDWADMTGANQRYWMQIRSDGAGAYADSSSLVSVIQGVSHDWILDSKNPASPVRTVFLDFTKPIPGTGPNGGPPVAPFTSALVFARLISKCHLYNNDMLAMAPGSTAACPLAIFFSDSGNEYFLHMNPVTGADVFPETDYVDVTCNGATGSQCSNWTIAPNGWNGGCLSADCSVKQNVARLSLRVPVKGKSGSWTAVNQGDFFVAFSIGVTNP